MVTVAQAIFYFLMGCIIADWFTLRLAQWKLSHEENKRKKEDTIIFDRVMNLIKTNKVNFLSRYNSQVVFRFKTKVKNKREDLYFFMEKREIALFVDGNCQHTTNYIDPKLVEDICVELEKKFKSQIDDCVRILNGNIVDKGTLEKLNGVAGSIEATPLDEELDTLPIFNLDDVLDRINVVGYDNLTQEEKDFLSGLK